MVNVVTVVATTARTVLVLIHCLIALSIKAFKLLKRETQGKNPDKSYRPDRRRTFNSLP
jgi:hypothetical protein